MHEALRLLKLTLIGGGIFLIPLVVVVVFVGKAFQIVKVLAEPLDVGFQEVLMSFKRLGCGASSLLDDAT